MSDKSESALDYKLALENVYVETANLASAFQRMLNEPKSKQKGAPYIDEFVVLNQILFSYLASLASSFEGGDAKQNIGVEHLKRIRRTKQLLLGSIENIDQKTFQIAFEWPDITEITSQESSEALFIQGQLELIEKVSEDLGEISITLGTLAN